MTEAHDPTQTALAIFDALCERRVREFFDEELLGDLVDAWAVPGRAAELVTRLSAPVRTSLLARFAHQGASPPLANAVPAGVLELVVALLPQLPPPPRELVERAIGSAEVRAEVRRLLQDTLGDLVSRATGGGSRGLGVLGWGARAASAAGRGIVGALGGDLEAKLGEAVEFGVGLAQRRIVDLVSSAETSHRVGKELARITPRLLEARESDLARLIQRLPLPLFDGLAASLIAHNAARPRVRAILVTEAYALVERLSETTIGELLEAFGLRAPLRAATLRHGGRIVSLVTLHLERR